MWSGRFKCQLVLTVNGCGNSLGFFFFLFVFFAHRDITGFTNTSVISTRRPPKNHDNIMCTGSQYISDISTVEDTNLNLYYFKSQAMYLSDCTGMQQNNMICIKFHIMQKFQIF